MREAAVTVFAEHPDLLELGVSLEGWFPTGG